MKNGILTKENELEVRLSPNGTPIRYRIEALGEDLFAVAVEWRGNGEEVLAGERDAALALMKQLAAGAVTPTSLPDIAEDLGLPLLPRV